MHVQNVAIDVLVIHYIVAHTFCEVMLYTSRHQQGNLVINVWNPSREDDEQAPGFCSIMYERIGRIFTFCGSWISQAKHRSASSGEEWQTLNAEERAI
jgi:hypothetical protein